MGNTYRPDEWHEDQNEYTFEILSKVSPVPFTLQMGGPNKGCTLDHLDGSYGYITMQDATDQNWRIYDYETDKLLGTYDSIQALIDGGWKVST